MLTDNLFVQWCEKLGLSEETVKYIAGIRESPPARLVRSRVGNVSGRYPSKKMGWTIQFESCCNELAGIYEMEYDSQVLEYYDQPQPIKLLYEAKNGRNIGVLHTPDFFVQRVDSAGWEEWKTLEELESLAVKMPHRYQLRADGKWRCPPGEAIAQSMGLYYVIRTNKEINWNFQRNLRFLEDYFRTESLKVNDEIKEKIREIVSRFRGITLEELLGHGIPSDDIYTMIANREIYVDFDKHVLVNDSDKVQVWIDEKTAKVSDNSRLEGVSKSTYTGAITSSMSGLWDGTLWEIANIGLTHIALLNSDKKIIKIAKESFNELIKTGEFLIKNETQKLNSQTEEILKQASEDDCNEANRRYHIIAPCLQGEPVKNIGIPKRTIYRWLEDWRNAEAKYGYGYVGLLPRYTSRGNRERKLPQATQTLIDNFIKDNYENLKQKGKFAVYSGLHQACLASGLTPPSYKTFVTQINQRPRYEQVLKRRGNRNAYVHESFYWELESTTPRHGDRPFEICHIDHTELDIELISSRIKVNLGRPWATFLTDAYSRRILAIYLTFDPPSYRSCMMVMRECVSRHGRLPNTVVVDGGKEFHSVYFERLLAAYSCTKKTRPAAKPRFGSVCERLFGSANTMLIHNLQGNTQITRDVRGVTKSVNPRNLAVWTLASLYKNLCDWAYEFYDNKKHPALGQSPNEAFTEGLLRTGLRNHKIIPDDEMFRIFTLPTTNKGTAKVIPNNGVKINNIYYWHNNFRLAEVEKTQVPVRYDPYDMGVAYAYVKKQWVTCISQHYSSFTGHSEREIMLVSEELRKQYKNNSKQFVITASSLAEFLSQAEQEELVLLQRMRDLEAKDILARIDSRTASQSQSKESEVLVFPVNQEILMPTEEFIEEIKPYEEFW